MIVVQTAHHARPRSLEHQVSCCRSGLHYTIFIQDHRLNAEERKGLYGPNNIIHIYKHFDIFHKLTAEPGFMGVAPGSGVITWPPVSVCQNVSTIEHLPLPTTL